MINSIVFDDKIFMKKEHYFGISFAVVVSMLFILTAFGNSINQTEYCEGLSQQPLVNDSLILWSPSRKLTWDDFQAKPDTTSHYKAITSSWIGFESEVFNDSIILSVPCTFIKSQSWSVSKKNVALLAHEQLHFDITELVARKIRKDCSKHVSSSLTESSKILQSYYDKYYDEYWDNLNKNYDTETNHSINKEKQKEWELKIAKELKALEKYSSTRVVIKRVKR